MAQALGEICCESRNSHNSKGRITVPAFARFYRLHQARGPKHARSDRGDPTPLEPFGPADQLRRHEGPARGHDPVSHDPRRPRTRVVLARGASTSNPVGRLLRTLTGRTSSGGIASPSSSGTSRSRKPGPRRSPSTSCLATACRITSTISGSGRWATTATSSRGPGWSATMRRPSAWPSPSPTRRIGPTPSSRKRSSAKPGVTGPRPRPGCRGRTRGAWSPTWSTTRPTSEGPSPGSVGNFGRSISRRSRVTSGTWKLADLVERTSPCRTAGDQVNGWSRSPVCRSTEGSMPSRPRS